MLTGYVIHKQRTRDILLCAQLCLARPNCMSFNFENIKNGMCELNRETSHSDTIMDKNTLSPKRGYSFNQLVNISVSIYSWCKVKNVIYNEILASEIKVVMIH